MSVLGGIGNVFTTFKGRWRNFEEHVPTEADFNAGGIDPNDVTINIDQVRNRSLREAYPEYERREISLRELWWRHVRPTLSWVGTAGISTSAIDSTNTDSFARLLIQPYESDLEEDSPGFNFFNDLNNLFSRPKIPWETSDGNGGRQQVLGGPTLDEYTNLIKEQCVEGGNLYEYNSASRSFCEALDGHEEKFELFFKVFHQAALTTYINSGVFGPETRIRDVNDAFMGSPAAFWDNQERAAPGFITGDGNGDQLMETLGIDPIASDEPEQIKGTDAVLELLQRHQCVLSYKTEQIIRDFFSVQDRSLENILMYNSEDASLIVNTLNKKPNLIDFFNIPTEILSFAVPKIRLFKQLINEDGSTEPNSEENALEFKFESFTEGSSLTSITEEGRGRGRGVGIKDATWSFEGTNPEEVTSFIDFNLKLFVQNMSDLVDGVDFQEDSDPARQAVFGQREPNILQLLAAGVGGQAASEGNSNTYTVKAVIGWELDPSIDLGTLSSRTEEESSSIRDAIASTNKWLELTLYTSDISLGQDGTLEISLDYAASLDEQLSDDSMNILAINIGDSEETAIQSILRARDIDASNARSRLNDGQAAGSVEPEPCSAGLVRATEIPNPDDPEEQISLTSEEQAILAAARADNASDQNIFNNYNSIFDTLINSSKIYRMYLDETAIIGSELPQREGDSTVGSQLFRRLRRAGAVGGAASAVLGPVGLAVGGIGGAWAIHRARRPGASEEVTQENINQFTINSRSFSIEMLEKIPINKIERVIFDQPDDRIATAAPEVDIPEAEEAEEGQTQNERDRDNLRAVREAAGDINYSVDLQLELANQYSDEDSSVTIDFFRLGDLLDQIIKELKETPSSSLARRDEEAFKFISGVYTYVDGRGRRKGVNYCDILVSVDKFREFFLEKVIRRLRTKYDLKAFIIDMINEFSFLSGTGACIEGSSSPIRGESRPAFSVFQAPTINFDNLGARMAEDALNDILPSYFPTNTEGIGNVVPVVLAPEAADFFAENIESESYYGKEQIGNLSNYFAILSSNYSLSPAEGDTQIEKENFDSRRGIYHIKLGSDRGLLKNVNFRKDEVPGRREQRIIEAGGFNLSVLREKYDAELSLFGCPFLYPGMYIYIDPSLIGLGFADQQSSVAKVLGIGGYYFINKVSNSLNNKLEFETTLDLIWNSFGDHEECPITIIDSANFSLGEWMPGEARLPEGGALPEGDVLPGGEIVVSTPYDRALERGDPNAVLVRAVAGGTGGLGTTQNFQPAPGARFSTPEP
jgi:hypothetical protein